MRVTVIDILTNQCPYKQPIAINIDIIGVMLMQNGDVIKKTWILLDTCSTDSVTKHLDYVEDVNTYAKHKELIVLMNGGSLLFDQKGRFKIYACM